MRSECWFLLEFRARQTQKHGLLLWGNLRLRANPVDVLNGAAEEA